MEDQIQDTLALLEQGVQNVDPNLAVTHLRSWHSALDGVPHADELRALLMKVAELLEDGKLTEAGALMPVLGSETERVATQAPDELKPRLLALAERLHLSDGAGSDG